jgi:hypothetical protein
MTKGGFFQDGSDLVVGFGHDVVAEWVLAIVDVDATGALLGIEILGLLSKHPRLSSDDRRTPLNPGSFAVSVDHEANAIYVKFLHGRSVEQLVRYAVVVFDSDDRILAMRVRMEEAE